MTDIFLSYSSKDRERVRPFRDALDKLGFSVFWDLETPPGKNWNNWIFDHLARARAVVVFWTANSVASENVQDEADRAKRDNKLIPVRLDDPFDGDALPMGHNRRQIPFLGHWNGESTDTVWTSLLDAIKKLATPSWVLSSIEAMAAELRTQQMRSEQSRARECALDEQISKLVATEAAAQRQFDAERKRWKIELDQALADQQLMQMRLSRMNDRMVIFRKGSRSSGCPFQGTIANIE